MVRKRRSRLALERALEVAETWQEKALANYNLGLFHDNSSRETQAISCYQGAIKLGLDRNTEAEALAWLTSSLDKTGNPEEALQRLN